MLLGLDLVQWQLLQILVHEYNFLVNQKFTKDDAYSNRLRRRRFGLEKILYGLVQGGGDGSSGDHRLPDSASRVGLPADLDSSVP